jgi:glycosyltransferase involved in cell wall biosynthesis
MWRIFEPYYQLTRAGFVADWTTMGGCPYCGSGKRPDDVRIQDKPWRCPNPDCGKVSRASVAIDFVEVQLAMGRYNVVVTPRVVWPQEGVGDRWIKAIHTAGAAWVYECDDDVWSPMITRRQMSVFESEAAKGEQQLEWERQQRIRFLSQADAITVTTERLRSVILRHEPNANVYVVPNAISVSWFRRAMRGASRIKELEGHLTVGWFGGSRQSADLMPVAQAWARLAVRYPDVRFVLQGHVPAEVVMMMPPGSLVTLPWEDDLEAYPRIMHNYDIGCCAVWPSVFNTAKTPIKWFEFTLGGVPCVVSPYLYGPVVEDGVTALVADTTDEWEDCLARLIEDADLRRRVARVARRAVVRKHSLQNNLHRWLDAYSAAVDIFQARRARVLVGPDGRPL